MMTKKKLIQYSCKMNKMNKIRLKDCLYRGFYFNITHVKTIYYCVICQSFSQLLCDQLKLDILSDLLTLMSVLIKVGVVTLELNITSRKPMQEEKVLWPKAYKKCPHCKAGELSSRISRPGYMKLVFWKRVKRYKCDNCERKIYLFGRL